MPTNPSVRDAMNELAKHLAEQGDADAGLRALTAAAVDTLPGVEFASITVVKDEGDLRTYAPTDPLARRADDLQFEFREGPCYDAATEDGMFIAEDLAQDHRWPRYAPQAAALGVGAQMGIDLHPPTGTRAALNLYARKPTPFVDLMDEAETFASHAAIVLGFTRNVDQFKAALASRKTIGQAIGIVMERYQIDEDRAFDFLVRISSDSNVKLREVAADFVAGVNRRNPPPRADEGRES